MKKHLLALTLAIAASSTFAADQSVSFSGSTANFGSSSPVLDGGDDVISFSGLAAGVYDLTLGLVSTGNTLSSITLNNVPAVQQGSFFNGFVTFYGLQTTGTAPFVLTLTGTANLPGVSSYSGTLTALPVPEPGTYAMLLAGLGAMGLLRRRQA